MENDRNNRGLDSTLIAIFSIAAGLFFGLYLPDILPCTREKKLNHACLVSLLCSKLAAILLCDSFFYGIVILNT